MARRTWDDDLEDLPEVGVGELSEEERSLRRVIELSKEILQVCEQTNEWANEKSEALEKRLQSLKNVSKSVKAMDFRITPVLDEATKKEVQRQVQETVADSLKDIQEAVNSLEKAKKMEKGVWVSEGQLWYWGILFFSLSSLFMTVIGVKVAPWLDEQPLVVVLLVIGVICSNFVWYGIKWVRRRFFS